MAFNDYQNAHNKVFPMLSNTILELALYNNVKWPPDGRIHNFDLVILLLHMSFS
jgi:hypothetical protein